MSNTAFVVRVGEIHSVQLGRENNGRYVTSGCMLKEVAIICDDEFTNINKAGWVTISDYQH